MKVATPNALRPGLEGFLSSQARNRQVGAQLLDGGQGGGDLADP